MGQLRNVTHLLLCIVSTLVIGAAQAAEIETLLMPGKVSSAHASLEGTCANCHDRSDRSRQSSLCASCHKEVQEDLRAGTGFHGRLGGRQQMQCRACHSEHQGRDADIVKFVPEQFDHQRTDFPLRDAHELLACTSCHQQGKRYREASTTCVDCHRKDEPHQGKLGKDCAACHDSVTWAHMKFDHSKTSFALSGKHADTACIACHFGNRYDGTPQRCVSCHAPDDPHRGARGIECGSCHTTSAWTSQRFDHARETGFALLGAHTRTDCTGCHTSGRMEDPVPKDCHGCHRAEDQHAGRLGSACETCHTAERWQDSRFDHDTAGFALQGKHRDVDCHACHTANVVTQKLGTECANCHRASDVHAGKLGRQCDSCHSVDGWRAQVRFDHDLSAFPLIGQHVAVPCEQCHLTPAYAGTAASCYACHKSADKHQGSLGQQCDDCHSPNGWNIWTFDHERATGFALNGAHQKLQCAQCHREPATEVKLARDCASCHVKDDVHLGQFGRQCQQCHSTNSFRQVRIR
jgi:cytochrome c7-like protein